MSVMMPERTPETGWFLGQEQMAEHATGFSSRPRIHFPAEQTTRVLHKAAATKLGQPMHVWVNNQRYEATVFYVQCNCPSERFFLYVPLARLGVKLCWNFDYPDAPERPVAVQYITIQQPPLRPAPSLVNGWMHEWGTVPRW